MIVTEQKPLSEIIAGLTSFSKIFLVGCGECATACKTGGREELAKMEKELSEQGKTILGTCIPDAPCIASQIKTELAKNIALLRQAEAILVLSCGLGVQSVRDNNRTNSTVLPGCNTICSALMDAKGDFYEKCSLCGDCVLGITAGICPLTLCAKGILNGPCGGMNKGKCEIDSEKDCAWVLIYKELEKTGKLDSLKKIQLPKDFKKTTKPHRLILSSR